MKRIAPLLLLAAIVVLYGCSQSSSVTSVFVEDVWQAKADPEEICKNLSSDYTITQFQESISSEEDCRLTIELLQDGRTKGVATSLVTPGKSLALVCARNAFSENLALLPVLLSERGGRVREVHISPHVSFGGESDWNKTRGIEKASERARDSLPKPCRSLDPFPSAEVM